MNKDSLHRPDVMVRVFGEGGLLSQRLSAYEPRAAQITMARRVMACLDSSETLVVEAGTGTGKTLAYLVPAALSGMKVVISTGTKTLQEQIFRKDLPLLRSLLEMDLPAACMKGLSNYLCRRRLDELCRRPELFPDAHLPKLLEWVASTTTGDRADLAALPESAPLWAEVCSSPETRLGSRCRFFDDCFVTEMRRAAAGARLVFVNHHLLLADLALRHLHPEASVIPAFDALIVDEAHQIEAVATSFFGQTVSSASLTALARDTLRAARLLEDRRTEELAGHLAEVIAELVHLLQAELTSLGSRESPTGDGLLSARTRLESAPLAGALQGPYFALDAALEALGEHLVLRAAGREDVLQLARRMEVERETLSLFAEAPARGSIFWAEPLRSGIALHLSPIEVGPLLEETLHREPIPLVFTSATLSAPLGTGTQKEVTISGSKRLLSETPLTYFRRRVGLDAVDGVEELVVASPFHFATQALLYVPRDLPHPASPEFILRASERMSQLIDLTRGRALVLFTSYRHLRAARAHLAGQLSYPLLCQGDAPRPLLLERFRHDVSSVLLATASFWEGVDVVGESLSLVIMDKLPFAVPGDPLTAARIDLLREQGEDPFVAYQIPRAALSLKQGFGRLIRHREDRGIVAILDRRLHDRPYGRVLLESLPPCPRTSDLLRVRAFSKEVLGLPLTVAPSRRPR
jgi:ATP-dependent DNA helicase DinG